MGILKFEDSSIMEFHYTFSFYVSRQICMFLSFFYPAYLSFKVAKKAHSTKNLQLVKNWLLIYWIVFAVVNVLEFFLEILFSRIPLYWELKTLLVIWLQHPKYRGAELLYSKYVAPFLTVHQSNIDSHIDAISQKFDSKNYATLESVKQNFAGIQGAISSVADSLLTKEGKEFVGKLVDGSPTPKTPTTPTPPPSATKKSSSAPPSPTPSSPKTTATKKQPVAASSPKTSSVPSSPVPTSPASPSVGSGISSAVQFNPTPTLIAPERIGMRYLAKKREKEMAESGSSSSPLTELASMEGDDDEMLSVDSALNVHKRISSALNSGK